MDTEAVIKEIRVLSIRLEAVERQLAVLNASLRALSTIERLLRSIEGAVTYLRSRR